LEERKLEKEMMLEEKRLEQEERKLEQERMLEERKLEQERLWKEREMEWKESRANKLKLWGDALRNAISRMPVEPVDIVSWFQYLEKLFEQLKVPVELICCVDAPISERQSKIFAVASGFREIY